MFLNFFFLCSRLLVLCHLLSYVSEKVRNQELREAFLEDVHENKESNREAFAEDFDEKRSREA